MRPRRAVPLTPSSPTPALPQNVAKSCVCHTSENSPVTPIIATDPKMRSRKSCVCHTCDPLPRPPFHLLLLFLLSPQVTRHFQVPSLVVANLPLYFQAVAGCSPRNPFLFMLLHRCGGGGRGQTQKACSRPHNVLFQESLQSRHLCSPHPAQPRAGILVFPTSHQSRITSHFPGPAGNRSPLATSTVTPLECAVTKKGGRGCAPL